MMSGVLDLSGRRYLVTGAASGIGRAASLLLAECGAELILLDMNEDGLKEVAQECNGKVFPLAADLTDISSLKEKIKSTVSESGKLNGFVHCAGIPYISPLNAVNEAKAEKLYRINTYAAIELAKICSSKTVYSGDNGSIVLISSVYGLVGSAANVVYAMSKGAVIAITKSLAVELAAKGIRVNCIAPGFVKTNMMGGISGSFDAEYNARLEHLHPLGLGTAEDVANAILFMLSDMGRWVTGSVLSVDGGFTAQ